MPVALHYSGTGWARITVRSCQRFRARRLDGALVSPWLIIVSFREELKGRRYTCLIPCTQKNQDLHRQLRVLLRHPL